MNTKTQRTVAFHRKNILEAADKLFTQNGVEQTTMDRLAKEAGYSKPTLYGYFQDKDEVYFALVEVFMEELSAAIEKNISEHITFRQKYFGICHTIYAFANDHPLYFEGLIGNINVDLRAAETPQIYRDIYNTGEHINDMLKSLIEDGKKQGLIEPDLEASAALLFFWSSISGIVRMALLKKEYLRTLGLNPEEWIALGFERLLRGCAPLKRQE